MTFRMTLSQFLVKPAHKIDVMAFLKINESYRRQLIYKV